jgi:hypothetical protein
MNSEIKITKIKAQKPFSLSKSLAIADNSKLKLNH